MKNTFKKVLSILLTLSIVMGISSITYGAGEFIESVTIKSSTVRVSDGVAISGGSVSKLKENARVITVSPDNAASNDPPSATWKNEESGSVTWRKFTSSEAKALTNTGDISSGGVTYTNGALENGDVIIVGDGTNYYMLNIRVGNGGNVIGVSGVEELYYNVILPTSLDFSLHPIGEDQILSGSYALVNKTNYPVKVSFNLSAEGKEDSENGNDVTFVNSALSLDGKNNEIITTKKIYLSAIGATDTVGGTKPTHSNASTAATVFDYKHTNKESRVSFVPSTTDKKNADTTITFALAPSVDTDSDKIPDKLANNDKGFGSFTLYGEMNSYADWQSGDIKLTGTFKIVPLRTSTYKKIIDEDMLAVNSLNMIKSGEDYIDLYLEDSTNTNVGTVSKSDYEGGTFDIYVAGEPTKIETVIRMSPTVYVYEQGADYSYDPKTGMLNVKFFNKAPTGSVKFYIVTDSNSYYMTVNFV